MSANQILITQENASGEFAIKTFTPVAGQVMGFDAGLNPVPMEMLTGSSTPIVNTSQTSLTIDCSIADIFIMSLTASATFALTNVTASKQFIIKNASASSINISLPNGQTFDTATVPIASGKARRFIVEPINNKFYWDYSKELVNA